MEIISLISDRFKGGPFQMKFLWVLAKTRIEVCFQQLRLRGDPGLFWWMMIL